MTSAQRGLTLIELLVGVMLVLAVSTAILPLTAALSQATLSQPRAADEQQRVRGLVDQVSELIGRAGEGLDGDAASGFALRVPPLYPQRRGVSGADPDTSAFPDRLTILRLAETGAQATLAVPMAGPAWPVPIDEGSCGPGRPACGFTLGATALLADARTNGEWFAIATVAPGAIGHTPSTLTGSYTPADGARLAEVEVRAIAFDALRRQLRLLGPGMNLPLADGIAGFEVTWLGVPRPPRGPIPLAGQGTCLVDASGSPVLPTLAASDGPWVALPPENLSDGPFCGRQPWRFDADLYRVRMLVLRVSFQAAAALPGPAPARPPAGVEITLAPANLRRLS